MIIQLKQLVEASHNVYRPKQPSIDSSTADKVIWLAKEIFRTFPESVSGLVFYVMDCGCVYYRRKFVTGDIDPRLGIYRDAEDWKDKVVDETVVYNSKIEIG